MDWPRKQLTSNGQTCCAVTASHNQQHQQGTSEPGSGAVSPRHSRSQLGWGKPGQIHSKVSPLNPCHESDCLRQEGGTRGRKRNCKERIPGGQPQTACLVGPALAFLFYPGFSHPPPEPPPQETSPTSSMFTTIK